MLFARTPGRLLSEKLLPVMLPSRLTLLVIAVAFYATLGESACDIFKDESCFIDRKLVSAEGDDETFHVGMRFRVFVHDRNDVPVQGVRVELKHWKLHCDGTASLQSEVAGDTAENGVLSTQAQSVYPTYQITTHDDDIRISLTARAAYQSIDAQAFSWSDQWVYNVRALQRLPMSGGSSGGYRERTLLHEVILEYPYPK
jgi:hypothetical protein